MPRHDPSLTIEEADAAEPPASSLLASMADELDALYERVEGSLDSIPARPEQMRPPHGCFLVIRAEGDPIACGGVKRLEPGVAEIKRMYVAPSHRGRGIGRVLLGGLERRCRELGYRRVRLDTGPEQPAARAIYERAGYRRIPDYNRNPYASYWFEKELRGEPEVQAPERAG